MDRPTPPIAANPSPLAAMLLLADGRFPAGGHVHSGGIEVAVDDGRVRDLADLEAFTAGRLRTTGLVEAALAAATAHRLGPGARGRLTEVLAELDAETEARILAPPLRDASRRLGRQLLRAASRCWPSAMLAEAVQCAPARHSPTSGPGGWHQPVALGLVGASVGLDAEQVARLALHHAASTTTQAAVRLLGLDPFGAVAVCASLAGLTEELAGEAAASAPTTLAGLAAASSPLLEIAAVEHQLWDTRMFAT